MSKQVIFIGPLGGDSKMVAGDSLKNLHLTNRLRELSVSLRIVDTIKSNKSFIRKVLAVLFILFHRKSKFIVSASTTGAYRLLSLMKRFGISDVIYWVVGGDFPHLINCELISTKPYANARVIIVEGKRMEETLRIYGLNNVITLPNFKPIDFIPEKKPRETNAPVRFVFLSRIVEDKGCGYINKAAEILNEKGLGARFSIDYYGSITDSYKKSFLGEIGNIPNVEYKGFLKLVDRANYGVLAEYDAMLFPTFFYGEGFAGIFIDAFIAGLPVITFDWSLNSEIIRDGETGIVVENRNAAKLAAAMERLISNPQQIEAMSKKCQAQCMNYDSEHVVTKALMERIGLAY